MNYRFLVKFFRSVSAAFAAAALAFAQPAHGALSILSSPGNLEAGGDGDFLVFECEEEDLLNASGSVVARNVTVAVSPTGIAKVQRVSVDGLPTGLAGNSVSVPMYYHDGDTHAVTEGAVCVTGVAPGTATITLSSSTTRPVTTDVVVTAPEDIIFRSTSNGDPLTTLIVGESDRLNSGTLYLDFGYNINQAVNFTISNSDDGSHLSIYGTMRVGKGSRQAVVNFSPKDGPASVTLTFTGDTAYTNGASVTVMITNAPPRLVSPVGTEEDPTPREALQGAAAFLPAFANDVAADADVVYHWFVDGNEELVTNSASFLRSFTSDSFVRVYAEDKDGGRSQTGCFHVVVDDSDALEGGRPDDFLARSGTIGNNEKSWIETSVRGAGTLSFRWKVSCENRNDSLQLLVDGEARNRITGETDWKDVSLELEAAPHTIRWLYSKNRSEAVGEDAGWLADVVWTPVGLSVGEALDTEDVEVATSGDVCWIAAATSHASDGEDCMYSGHVGDGGVSRLETTVNGPGHLSFNFFVSGREGADWFDCFVDGEPVFSRTGEVAWTRETFELGDGEHVVAWEWFRGDSDEPESGSGQAGLDQLAWVSTKPDHIFVNGVEIPVSWLDTTAQSFLAAAGGDYEAAALATAANGVNKVWECYVAGLVPTDDGARFRAKIEMKDGAAVVTPDPDLGAERVYTVIGAETLPEAFGPTNAASRFFRVKVELP